MQKKKFKKKYQKLEYWGYKIMENLFISYQNYKGGINNLCIVEDIKGNYGTSTKGKEKAIQNYYKNLKRVV